jgi:hypothetical protein
MRARSSRSQTPSRSEIWMSRIVALDDSAPSMPPIETRESGVESAREIRFARNALLLVRGPDRERREPGSGQRQEDEAQVEEPPHQKDCPIET